MNRRAGLGAYQRKLQTEAKYREKREELAKDEIQTLTKQMSEFQQKLQEFAQKHKKDIKRDPEFRRHFQAMCATVGVDPLQSSANFWTKLLGVGDFYYELAVQAIEVCMSTSHRNGGLIGIHELHRRVIQSRNSAKAIGSGGHHRHEDEITVDDLIRAIEKLAKLGSGLKLMSCGKTYLVQSVASELSLDQNLIIQTAQSTNGCIDISMIVKELQWTDERARKAIDDMIMEGLLWIDKQTPSGQTWYWFPGLRQSVS
ncbi:vacuolar-sorting protein SNF8-like [Oppia nitens]|uniref:vacuolar-sorting protein SNF8-like n=1 Tax=Oppia nitens TaxID=1686743 RepID=UPI0023DC360F|nr:vacuolar-sorting protein SNF8-like [Oppia nitens]